MEKRKFDVLIFCWVLDAKYDGHNEMKNVSQNMKAGKHIRSHVLMFLLSRTPRFMPAVSRKLYSKKTNKKKISTPT